MDEELKSRLVKYLDGLESGMKSAGDFAAEQIPDVIQQWLTWLFWSNAVYASLIICVCIGIVFSIHKAWKIAPSHRDPDGIRGFSLVVGLPALLIAIGFAVEFSSNALKVALAPKVVIIEEVVSLTKDVK